MKTEVELRGITHRVTRQKTSFSFSQLDALFYFRKHIALIARVLQFIDFQHFPV